MAPKKRVRVNKNRVLDDYFVLPHPLWMIAISFGLWFLTITTVSPDKVPSSLGPLSTFAKFMGKSHPTVCYIICVLTVLCHCAESMYASKLCQDKGLTVGSTIKWTLSTMAFGFSSLIRLRPYQSTVKID